MKKVGLYPGSFNPWHEGHSDVLSKALSLFDEIVIASPVFKINAAKMTELTEIYKKIRFETIDGLLPDHIKYSKYTAVIRGLRNSNDLRYEQNQQYWYEDLGLKIPIVYFITDRKLGHISSSAIRALNKLGEYNNET